MTEKNLAPWQVRHVRNYNTYSNFFAGRLYDQGFNPVADYVRRLNFETRILNTGKKEGIRHNMPYFWEGLHYLDCYMGGSTNLSNLAAQKRSVIKSFSRQSRKRFTLAIDRYVTFRPTCFLCLTFEKNLHDVLAAKKALKEFCRRLDRYAMFKPLYAWKMEFQKRGAVHFHLLTNLEPAADFKAGKMNNKKGVSADFILICQKIWSRIQKGYWTKKDNSFDYKRVTSEKGVIWYVSQYVNKKNYQTEIDANKYEHIGRFWGFINRAAYKKTIVAPVKHYIQDSKIIAWVQNVLHSSDKAGYDFRRRKYCSNFCFKPADFEKDWLQLILDYMIAHDDYTYDIEHELRQERIEKVLTTWQNT